MTRYLLIGALALWAAGSANAALITRDLTLTATDFQSDFGDTPLDQVTVHFQLTFDDAADISPTTDGLTIVDTNLTGWNFAYSYDYRGDYLNLGSHLTQYGPDTSVWMQDVGTTIYNLSTAPTVYELDYTNGSIAEGRRGSYESTNVTVTDNAPAATDPGGAVPEPASWAMMLAGFGAIGSALRRRRTSVRFA